MKLLILGLLLMGMGLSACGTKEDPLDGKNQGTQEAQKPLEQKPLPGDVDQLLRISASADTFRFKEGQKGKYVINGAILIPDAQYTLSILNLSDFPEQDNKTATFDATTGTFTWTPPVGFVDTVTEKQLSLNVQIVSVASATLTNIRSGSKKIEVRIAASDKIPTIEAVKFEAGKSSLREEEVLNFDVQVRDITAQNVDGSRPSIIFLPSKDGDVQVASIITFETDNGANPEVDAKDPFLWTFHFQIDLRGREITTSQANLKMNMVAVSNFKQTSAPMTEDIYVKTGLHKPQVTWQKPQFMRAGQLNSFSFMIWDPRGEGQVGVKYPDCSKIVAGLVCGTCVSNTDSGVEVLYCPVTWDIPADYFSKNGKDTVRVPFEVTSKSKIRNDSFALPNQPMTGVIKILHADTPPIPAPVPSPTPGPSPSPVPVMGGN